MGTTEFAGFPDEEDRIRRLYRLRLQQIQHIELLRLDGITDSLAHSVLASAANSNWGKLVRES